MFPWCLLPQNYLILDLEHCFLECNIQTSSLVINITKGSCLNAKTPLAIPQNTWTRPWREGPVCIQQAFQATMMFLTCENYCLISELLRKPKSPVSFGATRNRDDESWGDSWKSAYLTVPKAMNSVSTPTPPPHTNTQWRRWLSDSWKSAYLAVRKAVNPVSTHGEDGFQTLPWGIASTVIPGGKCTLFCM